jgi:hypothetical protein
MRKYFPESFFTFLTIYIYIMINLLNIVIPWSNKSGLGLGFMVFNTTFNNISVISWRSVLLVEETGVPGENHRPVESH